MLVAPIDRIGRWLAWGTLLAVVVGGLWALRNSTGTEDVRFWNLWLDNAMQFGPVRGYSAVHQDYPPGASIILWIGGQSAAGLGMDVREGTRLMITVFLLASLTIWLAMTRSPVHATVGFASLAINSLGLLYLDVFVVPFLLGAIWAGHSHRYRLGATLLLTAAFIKWQPVLILPFAFTHFLMQRDVQTHDHWRRELVAVVGVTFAATAAVLLTYRMPVVLALRQAGLENNLSSNAANIGWILTWILQRLNLFGIGELTANGVILQYIRAGVVIELAMKLLAWAALLGVAVTHYLSGDRTTVGFLRFSLLGFFAYFLLSSSMHENYLMVPTVLALTLGAFDRRWLLMALLVALSANLNMVAFYGWTGAGSRHAVAGVDVVVWLAVANLVLFGTLARFTYRDSALACHARAGQLAARARMGIALSRSANAVKFLGHS